MSNLLKSNIIPTDLAQFRIDRFTEKKVHIDQELHCNVRPYIEATANAFYQLMTNIKDNGESFRCYFAKDDDDDSNLNLSIIFSITDENHDNIDMFYKISTQDRQLHEVQPYDVRTKWVGLVDPILKASGKTQPPNGETKSIFYDVDHVDELIDLFQNHVKKVKINYAAYRVSHNPKPTQDDSKYLNQLGLIFEIETLHTFDGKTNFYFGFSRKETQATNYVDTGVPCPPPPQPGGKCPGA